MEKELCFVTVIGEDQKGIIAKMANSVYEKDINIEDISQKVIEGYFVMSMLVDVKDSDSGLDEIEEDLQKLARIWGSKFSSSMRISSSRCIGSEYGFHSRRDFRNCEHDAPSGTGYKNSHAGDKSEGLRPLGLR